MYINIKRKETDHKKQSMCLRATVSCIERLEYNFGIIDLKYIAKINLLAMTYVLFLEKNDINI